MNKLYILTGPAGVGKSTISEKIASSLEKSVLIEGDDIYNQFVGGRISPWKEDAPLDLFWGNCINLINNYLSSGYDVVFNYIIKKDKFALLKDKFKDYEIKFTVLLVDEKTVIERDKQRPLDCQMGERSLILLNEFIKENYDENYILDSSNLSVDDTVNKIINEDRFMVKRMSIEDIKTPEDILKYMEDNISYGWKDFSNYNHIGNMKNFRRLYRTSSLEETLENKFGTCIEQVNLMNYLLNKIGIKTKMFCTRIYEGKDFNNLDEDEHMHCFVLYYLNDHVYHIEHPNWKKVGIYQYDSEEEAIKSINDYYVSMSGGKPRPVTEFFEIKEGLSFKEFNNYINSLDKKLTYSNISIIEYNEKYLEDVKDLLVELEEYIIKIDKDNLDRLHPEYREKMALLDLEEINNYEGKCYLAIENNKAVGLIMGCIPPYDEYDYLDYKCPRRGEITELIVSSKARSKGIGNILINKMEEYFKKERCEYTIVDVFAYNQTAFNFYTKNNYHTRLKVMIKKLD